MSKLVKSLSFLIVISVFFVLFLYVNLLNGETIGETYIPPVPNRSEVLPANDGNADGCGSSRFDCVMGGEAILDKQTGLVWARDTEILEKPLPWQDAMTFTENVEIGGKKGWRLPSRDELISILDTSQSNPALPEGHPFFKMNDWKTGEDTPIYWTSTEEQGDIPRAWTITMSVGRVADSVTLFDYKIWPVRESE